MKKFIFSIIALLIIIASGLITIKFFKTSSEQITESIERTSAMVTENNWESAKTHIDNIEKKWDKTEKTWALLTDHIEIDNIELSMKKSKQYIESNSGPLALAELESLKFMVKHIYSKELINMKNIF